MPVSINGSGAITGVSVGGLPDGIVDADTLATNSVTTAKIANFLSDKGYHIVLNNLPGHGTTVDDCNNTKFQEWLDFSKVEFAKLCSKSDKVFIIGHSMGGVVALHLATMFPVTGLILGGVVLKFKLFYFTNYINRFLCKIIKHREKKLTFEKSIRDSITFYGYNDTNAWTVTRHSHLDTTSYIYFEASYQTT